MKIYVDLVFFLNFFLDFLLLITVKIILKRIVKIRRIVLGSFIGSLSIILLFFKINSIVLFFIKVLISVFMILVSFGYKDKNYFIKNISYLYLVSIILGGFLYYLKVQFSYNYFFIIISPIILYFYIKQERELKNNNYYHKVEIKIKNKTYIYSAYLDTGNTLKDPYTNIPVIILYDDNLVVNNPIYIPFHTVSNSGILEGFKINKIIIDEEIINKKVIIALTKNKLNIDGVDMLLNNDLFL